MMAILAWLAALPASVKRVALGLVLCAAVVSGAYCGGRHRGVVETRAHLTDSLQAVVIARLATQRESLKAVARSAADSAQHEREATRHAVDHWHQAVASISLTPRVTSVAGGDTDTVTIQYPDGTTRLYPVLPAVDTLIRRMADEGHRKDSLLAAADSIHRQALRALADDSLAYAKLYRAGTATDSMNVVLARQNASLARHLAAAQPSAAGTITRPIVVGLAIYGALQLYRALRP